MEIIRIVDAQQQKKIFAVIQGKGRVVLFEGDKYPKGGIGDVTKKQLEAEIKTATAE